MKNMKNIISRAAKIVGLCAVACTLGFSQSKAADIKFEVKVPGYTQRGNGWALVLPELRSVLGGKVHWDSGRNQYITDRVSRGETMKITITPTTPAERCDSMACVGIGPGDIWTFNKDVRLPYVINNFWVSTNPAYDNVFVKVHTTSGWYSKRIPIGTR